MIENCKELCDFYDELVQKVGEFSFVLQSDGSTILNSAMKIDPLKDPITFIEEAAYSIRILFQKQFEESSDLEKIGIYI